MEISLDYTCPTITMSVIWIFLFRCLQPYLSKCGLPEGGGGHCGYPQTCSPPQINKPGIYTYYIHLSKHMISCPLQFKITFNYFNCTTYVNHAQFVAINVRTHQSTYVVTMASHGWRVPLVDSSEILYNIFNEYIVATLGQLNSLCVMCYIIFRCPLCQLFYVHVL